MIQLISWVKSNKFLPWWLFIIRYSSKFRSKHGLCIQSSSWTLSCLWRCFSYFLSFVFPVTFGVQMNVAASRFSWHLQSLWCCAAGLVFFLYLAVIQNLSVHVLSFLFVFLHSDYLLYFCCGLAAYLWNIIPIFLHPLVFSDDNSFISFAFYRASSELCVITQRVLQ